MTVNEIVDELRASRPRAGEALRLQVLTAASAPPVPTRSLRERVGDRRRLLFALPAAAGLAVVAALAIGVSRPSPVGGEAAAPTAESRQNARASAPATTFAGPAADASAAGVAKAAPGPTGGRAQSYTADLALSVEDTDALSQATQSALAIARELGGYVVSVQYATGDQAAASLTLRVPSTRAADAVTRLSALGTIVAQNVQIDDLQETLDALDRQLERTRAEIAALTAALARADTAAERARLLERRARAQAELRDLRANRSATAETARNATIQLRLQATQGSGVSAPGSRLDRAIDRALEILAWEGVVALAIAVALAPLALVAVAVWGTRRVRRRREDERLLATS
jgi:hypothetical protein